MNNKKTIARRKILKAAAISGGAVVGAKSLPNTWTQPVMNAVVTPAHAQTSADTIDDTSDDTMAITGTFAASGLTGGPTVTINHWLHQPQLAFLDVVVPQAMANAGVLNAFCGDGNTSFFNTFDLLFRVNEDGTVDIAMDGGFFNSSGGDAFPVICGGNSTITGTAIADASIGIGNDEGGPECRLDLSGMVASESEITGNWQFVDGDANSDAIACGGMFAAALGGDFPTTASCANQLITTNT